jgi:hypothetical protein
VEHVKLAADESEPFVVGATFYGPTCGDAVDSLESKACTGVDSIHAGNSSATFYRASCGFLAIFFVFRPHEEWSVPKERLVACDDTPKVVSCRALLREAHEYRASGISRLGDVQHD